MAGNVTIAAFSDAHGNSLALEAVLKDIQAQAPDLIVNLGDQVWGQVDPLGAYHLQADLQAVEVRGNNDEKPLLSNLPAFESRYASWLAERVPAEALRRLGELPVQAPLLDGTVLAAHGTPSSPWQLLLWQVAAGELVERPLAEVAAELEALAGVTELVLVGHTHRERTVRLQERLIVNVGPVAWQRDGDPRARWTLLTRASGRWTAEQRRVEYDWQAAAAAVLANRPVFAPEADSHLFGMSQRPPTLH